MLTLAKTGDGIREVRPGAGGNEGRGTLRMIGGVPSRKIDGPVIRLAGPVIGGMPVVCVVIERIIGTHFGAWLVTADGTEHRAPGSVSVNGKDVLRRRWLRHAVLSGIFAGIARMG